MNKATTGPLPLHSLFHLLPLLLFHVSPACLSAHSGHPARYFGQIAENSPAGTPVDGVVLSVGAGGCPGADLNASLKGDYASDFRLVHHSGHRDHWRYLGLISAKPLDREFIAMYELMVALPQRCLRRPVAVQVEVADQNDNIPRFTSGNKTIEVDELTPLGTELARFDAKDSDAERNGRVTVYASPGSHLFHVVPQTGQVKLVGSLLGVSQVTLHLYVKDDGDVALIGEPVFLRVIVRHSSRARRRPRALSEELTYTVTVPDHVRVGDLVFTVPDQMFEQRWFEVISDPDSPVQIERDSGRLYLARSLREPAEVVVKIQNLRDSLFLPACHVSTSIITHHCIHLPLVISWFSLLHTVYARPFSVCSPVVCLLTLTCSLTRYPTLQLSIPQLCTLQPACLISCQLNAACLSRPEPALSLSPISSQ